ncbi:MAG: hypothetical protein P4L40_24185 [Terracidiphilus sp.]|nr:hypothetical protein [Terracidiphilus sp.]
MGLPPVSTIRGDGLPDPCRTSRIEATRLAVDTVTAMSERQQGQHAQEQEQTYEDAEFVEISELETADDTAGEAGLTPGPRFHAIA